MARLTPKIMLSAAFLFVLPVIGGQVQGYPQPGIHKAESSGQSVHFKSSNWPQIQQASVAPTTDPARI